MSTTVTGECPECEFTFTAAELGVGETLACPECALTLQVRAVDGGALALEAVETELPDWGE
ncbi:lysine biosynthesis protein LysW [Amycolatopsis anabasis]|uniref:lysine biosynthesis protein LysW n=1 Tax=Amycolatopsis anabasis TaxID=1840409 RepID=UPI00131CA89F|nr:lysine biosynthesis protein LysW [Amycolatopsis anabasis]